MITSEKALEIILNSTQNFGEEAIEFHKTSGRILKETIVADRDFPPFDRVAMDGIAIDFNTFQKGQKSFKVEGTQASGSPQMTLNSNSNCVEVMTGAMLPKNTNAVIRFEDIEIKNGIATILIDEVTDFQNIHKQGSDRKKADILIEKNKIISAAEVGVFATVGKSKVKVAKQPKVIIISTGDELVAVNEIPEPHQIRRSNVFALFSLLEKLNIKTKIDHILDDKDVLKNKIEKHLKEFDVLLFSGAVSKGKFDYLPQVFEELGVEKQFHRVSQRPGKPFYFGKTNDCTLFGFPGNPVSTFACCLAYFYPWYLKCNGIETKQETAILTEDVTFPPKLTFFLQVKLSYKYGHLLATPILGNGSGDLASLVNADGFIQLPKTTETVFKQGENFPVIKFR